MPYKKICTSVVLSVDSKLQVITFNKKGRLKYFLIAILDKFPQKCFFFSFFFCLHSNFSTSGVVVIKILLILISTEYFVFLIVFCPLIIKCMFIFPF